MQVRYFEHAGGSVTHKTCNRNSALYVEYLQMNINFGKRVIFFLESRWLQIVIRGSDK